MLKTLCKSLSALFCLTTLSFATTYVVDNDPECSGTEFLGLCWFGSYQACDGSTTYSSSIANAINAATNNWANRPHTIEICSGIYNENNINFDTSALDDALITSRTANLDDVLITTNSSHPIFKITSFMNGLKIKNLTLFNTNGNAISHTGGNLQNALFQNLKITSKGYSLSFVQAQNINIKDVNLTATNSSAIYAQSPTGSIIVDIENYLTNQITARENAIYLGNQSQSHTIKNSLITTFGSNSASITASGLGALTIKNVHIDSSNNGAGVWIDGVINSIDIQDSSFSNIKNENIYIKTINSSGSIIKNNIMNSGTSGIYLKSFSNPITIQNNIIENMSYRGLYLLDNSAWRASQIDHNCFINNTTQAYSRDSSANFNENYWNDWSGNGAYRIENIPRYDNNPLTFCPMSDVITPILDYRMDECIWSGVSAEVKDSSGNNLHATALNSDTDSLQSGVINTAGNFDRTKSQYIKLPTLPTDKVNFNDGFSVTAWARFSGTGSRGWERIFDFGRGENKNNIFLGRDWTSNTLVLGIHETNSSDPINVYLKASGAIDTSWHFWAVSCSGSTCKLYKDGTEIASSSTMNIPLNIDRTTNYIAESNWAVDDYFQGSIDELKVFDASLSANQISTIYTNESAQKNYDATPRDTPCCCAPMNGNLIANPSFEILCDSDILQTWNVSGGIVHLRNGLCGWSIASTIETWENTTEKPASDGVVFTEIDGNSGVVDKIWQTLDTVDGKSYVISFDYKKRDTSHSDVIVAKWNDVTILQVEGDTTAWQTAQIQVIGTAGADKLSFEEPSASNDSFGSWIDNIRVAVGTLDKNSFFDAWETTGSLSNRSIQTKIVSQDFTLNVASLNETDDDYLDFNGTVCAKVVDSDGKELTTWNKLLFSSSHPQIQTTTFNSIHASKDARVALSWKNKEDTTCPIIEEDNSTKSTDHFAIRPKNFTISNATTAYAGDRFTLDFNALNNLGTNSLDYNESKDGSFQITSVIGKNGCTNGVLNISNFSFADGLKTLVDANYSEVGDVNITLAEKLGSEFAGIDKNDTDAVNRLITPLTQVLSIQTYELNVTDVHFRSSNTFDWLYMANLNEMNVTSSATVKANNKQHELLKNFDVNCYAKDVNLTFFYAVENPQDVNFSSTLNASKSINDINETVAINASKFSEGSASIEYSFNIDRNHTIPLNPITITLKDVNVTSIDVAKDENNATVGISNKLYYGRVTTKDVTTNQQDINHDAKIEVYSTASLSSFKQNSINWYEMQEDSLDYTNKMDFYPKKAFALASDDQNDSLHVTLQNVSEGVVNIVLEKQTPYSSDDAYIHLDIPSYLWYNQYSDYNFTNTSNCSGHPCFRYIYTSTGGRENISSGNFTGSNISDRNYTGETKKSGVKTFR